MSAEKPHIAIIAPNMDGNDVGEVATSFQLLKHMLAQDRALFTVLTLHQAGRVPLTEQLPGVDVVTWHEPPWFKKTERFNAMAKPAVFWFYRKLRVWLKEAQGRGENFDLIHQMLPRAPRYPSPLPGLGVPYIIGPVGGAIPNHPAFKGDIQETWFARLRAMDPLRFRFDPWLRRGFEQADLVLGVAPYMADILSDMKLKRFEPFLGIGIEDLPPLHEREAVPGRLKLLFVGRAVRTKGLSEAVRAVGLVRDAADVTLTVIGDGDEIQPARALALASGVADRVQFLGRLARPDIEEHYKAADALLFPSFRESMGGVIYEAMRWGLPVITVDYGGPGFIVDSASGIKVPMSSPEQMPADLCASIKRLANDVEVRRRLSLGARERAMNEAVWSEKAKRMFAIYETLLQHR